MKPKVHIVYVYYPESYKVVRNGVEIFCGWTLKSAKRFIREMGFKLVSK